MRLRIGREPRAVARHGWMPCADGRPAPCGPGRGRRGGCMSACAAGAGARAVLGRSAVASGAAPAPQPQQQQRQYNPFGGGSAGPAVRSRSRQRRRRIIRARRRRRAASAGFAAADHLAVVVMGDAMADWLAYGLEDAFSEKPEFGIVRKHRTYLRPGPLRPAPRDRMGAGRARDRSRPRSRNSSS